MAVNGMSVGAVALMGGGFLFLWSGYHGAHITGSLRDLLGGKQPSTGTGDLAVGSPVVATGNAAAAYTGSSGGGGGPVLGSYSNAQLQQLWISNGGDPSKAAAAACIAMHESSGNPGAVNRGGPGPGCDAVGLWQLATPCGKGAGYSEAQLKDPNLNARLTVMGTRNGTDWSAWATAGMCGV